ALSGSHDRGQRASCLFVVAVAPLPSPGNQPFDVNSEEFLAPAVRQKCQPGQQLADRDGTDRRLVAALAQPSHDALVRRRTHSLRPDVRVDENHAKVTGSRGCPPRSGTGSGPPGGTDAISSSHQETKSSSVATASSKMTRASASTDRPCAAARRRSAGFSD